MQHSLEKRLVSMELTNNSMIIHLSNNKISYCHFEEAFVSFIEEIASGTIR